MLSPDICKTCAGNSGFYLATTSYPYTHWICKHDDCLEVRFITEYSAIPKVCRRKFEQCVATGVNIDKAGSDDNV
jgi:hypothetical protein